MSVSCPLALAPLEGDVSDGLVSAEPPLRRVKKGREKISVKRRDATKDVRVATNVGGESSTIEEYSLCKVIRYVSIPLSHQKERGWPRSRCLLSNTYQGNVGSKFYSLHDTLLDQIFNSYQVRIPRFVFSEIRQYAEEQGSFVGILASEW